MAQKNNTMEEDIQLIFDSVYVDGELMGYNLLLKNYTNKKSLIVKSFSWSDNIEEKEKTLNKINKLLERI